MTCWNSIGVIGKPHAAQQSLPVFEKLHRLFVEWNINAYFETEIGALLNLAQSICFAAETLIQKSDLILVVGGDGSMLGAARLVVQYAKPVLGINRGHLGFLTDIAPGELDNRLYQVLQGAYWLETRMLLEGKIIRNQTIVGEYRALNDIVLSIGGSSQLIEFDLWLNDAFVCRQRADGLIISSPTGSTAYALSAGGPIIHPKLDVIAIVPMLPHKLSSRPIVVGNEVDIKIVLTPVCTSPGRLSFDSQQSFDLSAGDIIYIRQCVERLHLLHPKDYDYFQALRDKLHWESK